MKDYKMYRDDFHDPYREYHQPNYDSPQYFYQPKDPSQQPYYQQDSRDYQSTQWNQELKEESLQEKLDRLSKQISGTMKQDERPKELSWDEKLDQLEKRLSSNLSTYQDHYYEPPSSPVNQSSQWDYQEPNWNQRFQRGSHYESMESVEDRVSEYEDHSNRIELDEPRYTLTVDSDIEEEDHGNKTSDLNEIIEETILPVEESVQISVSFKVGEGVVENNTTPYPLDLEETIFSPIDEENKIASSDAPKHT